MRSRRKFLRNLGLGAVFTFASARQAAFLKPNIVLIFSDDVSPDMYGCYGNKDAKTPNIDRIAKEGVQFNTAWACAICLPSRAMMLTGRYAGRTGFYMNGMSLPQKDGSDELLKYHHSFAKLVKEAGYKTAIAGKWHISASTPYGHDGGFDEYCLWEGLREIGHLKGSPKYTGGFENDDTTSRYWHPGIIKNHKLLKTKKNDFAPDIFTEFLMDFMERNKNRPFLAYYPMVAPHGTREGTTTTPLRGKVGAMEKSSDRHENIARFRALNDYIDVLVGRLREKVKDLGIADRTIFFYISDNGTAVTAKSRGVERGCRVPYVVSGAGIKNIGLTDEITDLTDILPTLVEFAGGKIPDGYEVDGKSLVPFLTGKSKAHRDWIQSTVGASQLFRTKRFLLEAVNQVLDYPKGRFYDCGKTRDGKGYKRAEKSKDPEAVKTRKLFEALRRKYPGLRKSNPYFQTKKGKKNMRAFMKESYKEKHLYNHRDFKFYDEK